jgi:hypothetical protein
VIRGWADLHGTFLEVRTADGALLRPLRAILGLTDAPSAGAPHFIWTIARGPVLPTSAEATLLFDGRMQDGLHCVVNRIAAGELYTIPHRLSLLVRPEIAEMVVAPGEERLVGGSMGLKALDAALAAGGQMLVHAAALGLPERQAAILLFAPSGAGKTTTTLALLAHGFQLLTDDASVLTRLADGEGVWGLTRSMKVHRNTAALLPWIAPMLAGEWDREGEQPLSPATLGEKVRIASHAPHRIAAVIVIGPRSGGDHRFSNLSKSETLVRLAGDNVANSRVGVLTEGRARLARLAELVTITPTFELNAGRNLESLPDLIRQNLI